MPTFAFACLYAGLSFVHASQDCQGDGCNVMVNSLLQSSRRETKTIHSTKATTKTTAYFSGRIISNVTGWTDKSGRYIVIRDADPDNSGQNCGGKWSVDSIGFYTDGNLARSPKGYYACSRSDYNIADNQNSCGAAECKGTDDTCDGWQSSATGSTAGYIGVDFGHNHNINGIKIKQKAGCGTSRVELLVNVLNVNSVPWVTWELNPDGGIFEDITETWNNPGGTNLAPPTVAPTAAPTVAPTAAPTVAPTAAPTVAPTYGCLAADFNCELAVFNKPTLVELVVKGTAVCQTMSWNEDPEKATQGRFQVEIEPTTATRDGYWNPAQFTVAGESYCFPLKNIHHLARQHDSGKFTLNFEPETLECSTARAAELMDEFNQLFPAGTLIETRKNCQEV